MSYRCDKVLVKLLGQQVITKKKCLEIGVESLAVAHEKGVASFPEEQNFDTLRTQSSNLDHHHNLFETRYLSC